MGSAKDFSALNTKISSMKKILLSDEDFEMLLNGDGLEDDLDFLYGKRLITKKDYNYPNEVEIDLKKNRIYYLNKSKYYLKNEYNILMDLILDKYYLEDIKKAARNIVNSNEKANRYGYIIRDDFANYVTEGYSIDDFLESLEDTRFYKYIRGYKNQEPNDILFFLGMSLDRGYFTSIYDESRELGKEDRKSVEKFYGEVIDLYNISWIYRGKKFYNMPSVVIFNYCIAGGNLFKLNDIKDLSYKPLNDFIDMVLKTEYSFLFQSDYDIDLYMERRMNRYLYYKSKDYIKNNKFDFTKTLGFALMTDYDIRDIFTILEAKKYGIKKEDIKKYLIRNIERNE